MKRKNWKSGKVTLVEILGTLFLVGPPFCGIAAGLSLGIMSVLTGLVIGLALGVGGLWGLSEVVRRLGLFQRWEQKPSIMESLAFFALAFLGAFGLMFLSMHMTESICQQVWA